MKITLHISLIFLLLMSMSDINKVVLLGYTLVTDSQKAAHFCTCTGCDQHSGDNHDDQANSDEPAMCMTTPDQSADQDKVLPGSNDSCCSSDGEGSKVNICQCGHDKPPAGDIALINTIDKTALFTPVKLINFASVRGSEFIYIPQQPLSYFKEIFRPPQ